MALEEFRWLAGMIAAHTGRNIAGRVRLQKTMYLLQRSGFPTMYTYSLHFYGPYSEELVSDMDLLEGIGLIEERRQGQDRNYYVYHAFPEAEVAEIDPYRQHIALLEQADATVLELAATYDAFRRLGYDHNESLRRTHVKKGAKCTPDGLAAALELLQSLGLPNS